MSLYPEWLDEDITIVEPEDEETQEGYGYHYDFNNKRVRVTTTGKTTKTTEHDSYLYWVFKNILTERYAYDAYSSDFGVEIEDIIARGYEKSVAESEIARTIKEALMIDERTIDVTDFVFAWSGDVLEVQFTLESIYNTDTLSLQRGVDTRGV